MASTPLRIALLTGGDSTERSVSLSSALSVESALQKYDVTVFDVASPATHTAHDAQFGGYQFINGCEPVTWIDLAATLQGRCDVVLAILHGGWGEDGTLQSLLSVAGIPYTGSGPRASGLAMDKQWTKALARDLDIPTARGLSVASLEDLQNGLPFAGACVVKPRGGGSSVGVTLLRDWNGDEKVLAQAVETALSDGNGVLIEELIDGVEISCTVLGAGESARSLPAIEIVPELGDGFYDFEAKYAAGGSKHVIPPRLPQDAVAAASGYALKIFRALGCRGVARADFIVRDGVPYFLEINTLPGMTSTSLVPDAARFIGIEFPELLDTLIEAAQ